MVDDRNQSLTEDSRLESDPLCINEAPYDKILDKFSFASIEGVIAATIRIYAAVPVCRNGGAVFYHEAARRI